MKTKLKELETSRTQAEEKVRTTADSDLIQQADIRHTHDITRVQAVRADATLSLVQVKHPRELQTLQEKVEELQARLVEEQRRSQQLEETLRLQAQQSSSQISMKQVDNC